MAIVQNPTDVTTIGITLPKEVHAMVVDGLSAQQNWRAKVMDPQTGKEIDNPKTQKEAARETIVDFVQQVVARYIQNKASQDAQAAAQAQAKTLIQEVKDGNMIKFENL